VRNRENRIRPLLGQQREVDTLVHHRLERTCDRNSTGNPKIVPISGQWLISGRIHYFGLRISHVYRDLSDCSRQDLRAVLPRTAAAHEEIDTGVRRAHQLIHRPDQPGSDGMVLEGFVDPGEGLFGGGHLLLGALPALTRPAAFLRSPEP